MRQGQPNTYSAKAAGAGPLQLTKEFKNHLVMFGSDPYSCIFHCNCYFFLISRESRVYAHFSCFCEFCRVREQIAQDEQEFCRVGPHREQLRTELPNENDRLLTEQKAHRLR